jgi:hypothetical protein
VQAVRNAVAHPNCDGLSLYNGGRYGCTIEQVKIVVDAGKCVGPNWERRANEAMYGSGAWAVDSARAGVEKWGIDPSTVPTILSAVDFGPSGDQYAQLDYWHETACDRADETNTWIGFYGETKYGNHLIQQPWWQRTGNRPTWTWGGSGMIADTNMKQHYGFPSGINWVLAALLALLAATIGALATGGVALYRIRTVDRRSADIEQVQALWEENRKRREDYEELETKYFDLSAKYDRCQVESRELKWQVAELRRRVDER